jgi:biopolymer transport protein ExbD
MSRRGANTRRSRRRAVTLDLVPLMDVVFILLIFFMVTTTLVKESAVNVARPSSAFAAETQAGFLGVSIDRDGVVHLEGKTLPADSVRAIRDALLRSEQKRVLLWADGAVPTSKLLQVMDSCKLAGATQVDVSAKQKE